MRLGPGIRALGQHSSSCNCRGTAGRPSPSGQAITFTAMSPSLWQTCSVILRTVRDKVNGHNEPDDVANNVMTYASTWTVL